MQFLWKSKHFKFPYCLKICKARIEKKLVAFIDLDLLRSDINILIFKNVDSLVKA